MAEQQKKKETRPTKPAEGGDGAAGSPQLAKKGQKIKEDIDKLLDQTYNSLYYKPNPILYIYNLPSKI